MVRFARSATKHGISKAQARFVVEHCGLPFVVPAPPGAAVPDDRLLFLGDDQHGVAVEVAAIELERGDLLVIHAMKCRAAYKRQYLEALECRLA